MLAGVIIAAQLIWSELNFGEPWLSYGRLRPPRQTWVVHGEPLAAGALRDGIRRKGWRAEVPVAGQTVEIA